MPFSGPSVSSLESGFDFTLGAAALPEVKVDKEDPSLLLGNRFRVRCLFIDTPPKCKDTIATLFKGVHLFLALPMPEHTHTKISSMGYLYRPKLSMICPQFAVGYTPLTICCPFHWSFQSTLNVRQGACPGPSSAMFPGRFIM